MKARNKTGIAVGSVFYDKWCSRLDVESIEVLSNKVVYIELKYEDGCKASCVAQNKKGVDRIVSIDYHWEYYANVDDARAEHLFLEKDNAVCEVVNAVNAIKWLLNH